MPAKNTNTTQAKETVQKQERPKPSAQDAALQNEHASPLWESAQRLMLDPAQLSRADVVSLQGSLGNQVVSRLLVQPKLTVGPADDPYEREADRVAEQVMSLNPESQHAATRGTANSPVQRQEEEEELQPKPIAATITPLVQRQFEEEEVQTKTSLQRQEEEEEIQLKPLAQRQEEEEQVQTKFSIQRVELEEEELQAKSTLQRQIEEEEIQTKPVLQRQEDEEEIQTSPNVQRQFEEEEIQTHRKVQRQDIDEEEVQTKPLQRLEEEEEPLQAKRELQRLEEEEEIQVKPLVQRQEDEEEIQTQTLQRGIDEEEEIQTKKAEGDPRAGFETTDGFQKRLEASQGTGQPLPGETREFMESRFGTDFGGVRLHTGADAAQLSKDVSAQAFTLGQDIYLGEGKYDPGSPGGKQLLAHELTHVVQQTGSQIRRINFTAKGKTAEAAAAHKKELERSPEERYDSALQLLASKPNRDGTVKVAGELVALRDLFPLKDNGTVRRDKDTLLQKIDKVCGSPASSWQARYLQTVLEEGVPTPVAKLAFTLGLVTNQQPDSDEFIRILEASDWSAHAAELSEVKKNSTLWSQFTKAMKSLQVGRSRIRLRAEAFLDLITAKQDRAKTPEDIAKLEEQHLLKIVEVHCGGVGKVDTPGLINDVREWAGKASPKGRELAGRTGGDLEKMLKGYITLRARDRVYIVSMVRGADLGMLAKLGLTPDDLKKSKETLEAEKESAKDDAARKAVEARQARLAGAGKVSELDALVGREISKAEAKIVKEKHGASGKLWGYQHRKLKAHIEGLSDSEREYYLVTLLPQTEAEKYWSSATEIEKKASFDKALRQLEGNLRQAGLKEKEVFALSGRFSFKGDLGNNYQQLVLCVGRQKDPATYKDEEKFGNDAYSRVTKLRGEEWGQARENAVVWEQLQKTGTWAPKILKLFGINSWTAALTALNREGKLKESAYQAEKNPDHWAALIDRKLETHYRGTRWATVARGKIVRIFYEAQGIADKYIDAKDPKFPFTYTKASFAQAVVDKLSPKSKEFIESKAGPALWLKIKGGTLDSGDIIDYAARGLISGIKVRQGEISTMIEVSTGKQLLEMSNFKAFQKHWVDLRAISKELTTAKEAQKTLQQEAKNLGDQLNTLKGTPQPNDRNAKRRRQQEERNLLSQQQAKQREATEKGTEIQAHQNKFSGKQSEIDSFIIDLDPDLILKLEAELGSITAQRTKSLVGIIAAGRRKIARAMEKEELFTNAVLGVGMDRGEVLVMQDRLRALALLDEDDLSKQGIQWHGVSVKAREREESAVIFKGLHAAMHTELKREKGLYTISLPTVETDIERILAGTFDPKKIELEQEQQRELNRLLAEYPAPTGKKVSEHLAELASGKKEKRSGIIEKRHEEIGKAEGEYTDRRKAFEEMQARYNGYLKKAIMILVGIAFAIGAGFLSFGGLSPFIIAAIGIAIAAAQKAIDMALEYAISGRIEMTRGQAVQQALMFVVEAGVTMAAAGVSTGIDALWQTATTNPLTNAQSALAEQFGEWAGTAKDWYKTTDGLVTAAGMAGEAAKNTGNVLVDKLVFSPFKKFMEEVITAENPFEEVKKHPGRVMASMTADLTKDTLLSFGTSMITQATSQAIKAQNIIQQNQLTKEIEQNKDMSLQALIPPKDITDLKGQLDQLQGSGKWIGYGSDWVTKTQELGLTTGTGLAYDQLLGNAFKDKEQAEKKDEEDKEGKEGEKKTSGVRSWRERASDTTSALRKSLAQIDIVKKVDAFKTEPNLDTWRQKILDSLTDLETKQKDAPSRGRLETEDITKLSVIMASVTSGNTTAEETQDNLKALIKTKLTLIRNVATIVKDPLKADFIRIVDKIDSEAKNMSPAGMAMAVDPLILDLIARVIADLQARVAIVKKDITVRHGGKDMRRRGTKPLHDTIDQLIPKMKPAITLVDLEAMAKDVNKLETDALPYKKP